MAAAHEKAARMIVVATGNEHKVEEIAAALHVDGWEFVALKSLGDFPEPIEDADSFEGNARIKALAAHNETGYAALADDSGLVVDALKGRPGVYSARYAGADAHDEDNNEKLLHDLAGVPHEDRTARFVSVLVMIDEQGCEHVARGACEGHIGVSPRGDNGFGYDPLFLPDVYEGACTMAELTMDQKNAISHRGRALTLLKTQLEGKGCEI